MSLPLARKLSLPVGDCPPCPILPEHAAPLPRGARVLLVDDVMTSGHTAEHAARALLRAGAGDVRVAVLLRTPAPGPPC